MPPKGTGIRQREAAAAAANPSTLLKFTQFQVRTVYLLSFVSIMSNHHFLFRVLGHWVFEWKECCFKFRKE